MDLEENIKKNEFAVAGFIIHELPLYLGHVSGCYHTFKTKTLTTMSKHRRELCLGGSEVRQYN